MDEKQAALLLVFVAYVASIPLFGLAYFLLYRRRQTHFVFAGDIHVSRLADEKQQVEDRICWLRRLLDYFERFASDRRQGTAREERSKERAVLYLSDGRVLVLEKHVQHAAPHGAESELAPVVRMQRADGTAEQEGRIVGHGFLSDFADWAEYVLAAIEPLKKDLQGAEARQIALESPRPTLWRYLDFIYFSTITQSTVGYGDILPNSTAARSIVMAQIVVAYALLVVVLNLVLSAK